MEKTNKKIEKKVIKKVGKTSKEERYTDERGEDVIKTTYPDGTVIVSTL